MSEHTIETREGLTMRWEEDGAGEPVVFIHGIPTGPRLWRHVTPELSRHRCLAWEMVGYGRSIAEGAGRDISMARQTEYLIRWMDAVDLDDAVLVGHDLGGGVAQIAAVRYPERVRGLVLIWPGSEVVRRTCGLCAMRHGLDVLMCIADDHEKEGNRQ